MTNEIIVELEWNPPNAWAKVSSMVGLVNSGFAVSVGNKLPQTLNNMIPPEIRDKVSDVWVFEVTKEDSFGSVVDIYNMTNKKVFRALEFNQIREIHGFVRQDPKKKYMYFKSKIEGGIVKKVGWGRGRRRETVAKYSVPAIVHKTSDKFISPNLRMIAKQRFGRFKDIYQLMTSRKTEGIKGFIRYGIRRRLGFIQDMLASIYSKEWRRVFR